MDFDEIRSFFFDLDKTLWNWDEPVIGAADTIDSLREADRKVYFHTDNSLLSRKEYARKLTEMGIPAEEEQVLTSSYVAAKHLAEKNVTEAYVIGESGLINELEKHDISVREDANTVVAGFDRQFNYQKLERAKDILDEDGRLVILSSEKTFRTSRDERPHQGVFNPAFREFGDATFLGKPSSEYRKRFKKYFSFFPGKSVMVGDRLADMETGNRLGMKTLAVMSGDIDRQELEEADEMQTPDYGLSSLVKLKRRVI